PGCHWDPTWIITTRRRKHRILGPNRGLVATPHIRDKEVLGGRWKSPSLLCQSDLDPKETIVVAVLWSMTDTMRRLGSPQMLRRQ
ncbi:MAG: hypothetical protein VX904_12885, partial [Planctomycetota bacterium]|nr:hypothetical protein [Planctomycetota bacterium]